MSPALFAPAGVLACLVAFRVALSHSARRQVRRRFAALTAAVQIPCDLRPSKVASLVPAGIALSSPIRRRRLRRAQVGLRSRLPEGLEAMARSLRSGSSLHHAVSEAGAEIGGLLGEELARVATEVGNGRPLTKALEGLALRQPSAQMDLVVAALCLGYEAGGAQARALDGVATTLRASLSLSSEVRALSSQARISALVIGVAPLVFALFAIATDSRTGAFLFGSPGGLLLLATGLSLDLIGWVWMRRLCDLKPRWSLTP